MVTIGVKPHLLPPRTTISVYTNRHTYPNFTSIGLRLRIRIGSTLVRKLDRYTKGYTWVRRFVNVIRTWKFYSDTDGRFNGQRGCSNVRWTSVFIKVSISIRVTDRVTDRVFVFVKFTYKKGDHYYYHLSKLLIRWT